MRALTHPESVHQLIRSIMYYQVCNMNTSNPVNYRLSYGKMTLSAG